MSLYRDLIVAVAAMTLATCVFATDTTGDTTTTTNENVADTAPASTSDVQTTTSKTDTTTTTTTTETKVNLNTATAKELMKVKGINAAKAKAIIIYRKKNGDFKSVDELKHVKGLNKLNAEILQAIEDQLTI